MTTRNVRRFGSLKIPAALALGALLGLTASSLMTRSAPKDDATLALTVTAATARVSPSPLSPADSATPSRGRAIGRSAPVSADVAAVSPHGDVDPQEMQRQSVARWVGLLRQYESETEDRDWGPEAATRLESELTQMSAKGKSFEVINVNCRSERCVAELEWKTRSLAMASRDAVVTHVFPINCARHIYLPNQSEEAPPGDQYRAKMIFECPRDLRTPAL